MSINTETQGAAGTLTPEKSKIVTDWIKSTAIPLKTVEAENGLEDMMPLKDVLKNVRVVGLGEATHGTREFYQAKHRLLEFLVKEMDYTIFAIETSYGECLEINDYVLHGKGDIDKLVAAQGFWVYNTQEVTDMVRWMRKYNETVPNEKKVQFYGFDVQRHGSAIKVVSEYLKEVDPDFEHHLEEIDDVLLRTRVDRIPRDKNEEYRQPILDKILRIAGHLAVHRFKFTNATSEEAFNNALEHARNLYEYFNMFTNSDRTTRDYYMAQNTRIILEDAPPGSKMVLWAHNAHMAAIPCYEGIIMGEELRKAYGDEYYILGFLFSQGGFQAVDHYEQALEKEEDPDNKKPQYLYVKDFYLDSVGDGMEQVFLNTGIPISFTDLRSAPTEGPVAEFLDNHQKSFNIGSHFATPTPPDNWKGENIFEKGYDYGYTPRKSFDGLLYVQSTTPARANALPPLSPG